MRHPVLLQPPFTPMTAEQAGRFAPLVAAALAEDGAADDVTSTAVIPAGARTNARVMMRSGGVAAGLPVVELVFACVDPRCVASAVVRDGDVMTSGAVLAMVTGPARAVLAGERVALNFIGRLSGIATLTRAFVDAVRGLPARICDTRKTTPELRALERYAVRAGGGFNHRFGLNDAVLVKDNHIVAAGSVAEALRRVRAAAPPDLIVEVECDSADQVEEAVSAGVDAVLLDNMALEQLARAVAIARGRAITEASGGIRLDNVRAVAQTGVDIISVGALTHSAAAADVALDFDVEG